MWSENEKDVLAVLFATLLAAVLAFGVVYWNTTRQHTLSSGPCRVAFKYRIDVDSLDEGYRLANNRLAHCLCRAYAAGKANIDTARLMHIYRKFGIPLKADNKLYQPHRLLNFIVQRRYTVFDTVHAFKNVYYRHNRAVTIFAE